MDSVLSPARYRHVIFTPPTRGRLRSAHAVFAPIDLPDELSLLPYDEETFLRSLFLQAELDVRSYRIETLKRRIPSCLRALRTPSLDKARWMVRHKPALLKVALNALLIGVTGFFRDPAVFDTLRTSLTDMAASARRRGRGLRIWSAACSEGAELYSVVILLAELGLLDTAGDVLGTDCRTDAVASARVGCYAADALDDVSPEWRDTYFRPEGSGWAVRDDLRAVPRWRTGDVLRLIEPGQWDVVLCRNMAMYLRPEAARRLWIGLESALRPGGLLVLGKAERPEGTRTLSLAGPCVFRRDRG
jgi:chemotaxis methyl-accepting protein methylase